LIEFHCKKHHKSDGTPVVTDLELQDYGEALLGEYKPRLLREPGKINPYHFVESYLGASLDYQDIYYREDEGPIAGATVFNDDHILVFDRDARCVRPIEVSAGTILIDNSVMKDGREAYATFTVLHEGSHYCVHPCVYRRDTQQLSLFDLVPASQGAHIVQCRRSAIESPKAKLVTQTDFREHQANTLAAAIAMPRPTFIPYAKELIRSTGFRDGIWVQPMIYDWELDYAYNSMIENLTKTYGVSKAAATVQLKRQGLLISEQDYLQQYSQIAVAF
jgi:hypothetical protein